MNPTRWTTPPMLAALSLALPLSLAGCGGESAGSGEATQTSGTDAAAPAWVLASAPAEPRGIAELKATAAEGDRVVLRGIIGGSAQPMSDESPVLRVVDTGLYNLCTAEDDHCSTPWDYCCADQAELASNAATVQVVNADGAPVRDSLREHGLGELDEVIVVGTVAPRPNETVLTVRATGVYRVR